MKQRSVDEDAFDRLLQEATADPDVLRPNTELLDGRFVIRTLLGSGGMGVVYKAMDRERSRNVALKVLSSVTPSGIYRLKHEFRGLAGVVHPNLVVLHELFLSQGTWFFTMELVQGKHLVDYLNVAHDIQKMKQAFLDLAAGIRMIHKAGKLHRDLKPSNVLVTPTGDVKILDFGLMSDQEAGGIGQTILADELSGTPTYMAPEQAAEEPSVMASDWYSYGVMLFEVLTGRPPFCGSPLRILERKQNEPAPRTSDICAGIPLEFEELCRSLLIRDPSRRAGYEDIMKVLGEIPEPPSVMCEDKDAPFVGREKELSLLDEALQTTDKGVPVVVFVQGASGIGKSTLVARFLESQEVRHNAVVLSGRCYERESVPFKTCDSLVDDLTRHLRRLPAPHAARMMPVRVASLARMFPVLNRVDAVRETRQRHRLPANPNELRRMAFLAAKDIMSRIAQEQPLILFIDDLQWSDVDGVRLLAALVSAPEPPSLLLIGAFRSEDKQTSEGLRLLQTLLDAIPKLDVFNVQLNQLNASDADALTHKLLSKKVSQAAEQIVKEAKGSPFLITELARHALVQPVTKGQAHLEQVIEHRLSGLPRWAHDLMAFIAVSGRPLDEQFLQKALDQDNISSPLRALESLRLIRETGGTPNKVACYHDRIRETVVAGLSPEDLKRRHQRLADILESDNNPDPVALTEHLIGADNYPLAGVYAEKAAKHAADTLAFENAARFYRIAIQSYQGDREGERQLQSALGDALANAGRGAEAASAYMQAAIDAPAEDALALRCRAALHWISTGHREEGTRELQNVLKAVGLSLDLSPLGLTWGYLSNRIRLRGAFRQISKPLSTDITNRQMLEIRACEAAAMGLWAADTFRSAAFSTRHLHLSIKAGNIPEIIKALCLEATYRVSQGTRYKNITELCIREAERLAKKVTDAEIRSYLLFAHGTINLVRGNIDKAVSYYEDAERCCLEECTRKTTILEKTHSFLGTAYARLGHWAILQRKWDRWAATAMEMGDRHHVAVCRMWMMGTIRWLAADQPETAAEQLDAGIRGWPWSQSSIQLYQSMISQSPIHLYKQELQEAFDIGAASNRLLYKTSLKRFQFLKSMHAIDYASAALALAAENKENAYPLSVAERQTAILNKDPVFSSASHVLFIKGAIACIKGDEDEGVRLLRKSIEGFESSGYVLHSAAVKIRIAKLLGGDEGQALKEAGLKVMKSEQIANPDRVTDILAPGFRN